MFKNNEEYSSQEEEDFLIEPSFVLSSTIDIDNLICSICFNVLWDASSCGGGCHAAFCTPCIQAWLSRTSNCPHCKLPFIKSSAPPILSLLLAQLTIKCLFSKEGCKEVLPYAHIHTHHKQCPFKRTLCPYSVKKCEGCKTMVSSIVYEAHTDLCEKYIVACVKCKAEMPKAQLPAHKLMDCMQNQVISLENRIKELANTVQEINEQTQRLENITKCFLSGQPLQLYISFYTTFNQHFVFPNPTLIKASYNQLKEKYDFLHFYIANPISINSLVNIKWAFRVQKMSGNILLGFCSSMSVNSLDYIVNKYGELKRKDIQQIRYRIVKKSDFSFGQGDVIRCKYVGLTKRVQIRNETRRVALGLGPSQLEEWDGKLYVFFSLDTLNDSLCFLQ